jgi:hypothetical protein
MFLYNKLSVKEGQTKIKHACYLSQTKIKHVISLYFIQLCVKESQTKTKHLISLYLQLGISLVCLYFFKYYPCFKKRKEKKNYTCTSPPLAKSLDLDHTYQLVSLLLYAPVIT